MTGVPARSVSSNAVKEKAVGFFGTLSQSPGVAFLAEKSGQDPMHVIGCLGLLCVGVFFGFGAKMLCNTIGFVYPMYKSFQAIEKTGMGVTKFPGHTFSEADFHDCVNVLMYWVVYTFFTLAEVFSDYLLFWIPFYYILKLAILIYCLKYDGAQKAYAMCFGPLLKQYEPHIERAVQEMGTYSKQFADDVQHGARGLAKTHSERITSSVMTGISKISQAVAEPSAAAEGGEDEIPSVAALGAKIPDASDANLDSKKAS